MEVADVVVEVAVEVIEVEVEVEDVVEAGALVVAQQQQQHPRSNSQHRMWLVASMRLQTRPRLRLEPTRPLGRPRLSLREPMLLST